MMNDMFSGAPVCGGTSSTTDENAPKEIISGEMTFLKISSSFMGVVELDAPQSENDWIEHISVYAAAIGGGVLVSLSARNRFDRSESSWGIIKEDIFPELVRTVREQKLAAQNGSHSFTYGLPENFGGDVLVRYKSGEKISYSSNQSPVIRKSFGVWLYEYFSEALKKERAELPDASPINEVRLLEKNSTGYTRYEIKRVSETTCETYRAYKFETPPISEYRDTAPVEVLENIREIVDKNALLIWNSLPLSDFEPIIEKSLTFIMENGDEITVYDNRLAPDMLSNGFFKVESELR